MQNSASTQYEQQSTTNNTMSNIKRRIENISWSHISETNEKEMILKLDLHQFQMENSFLRDNNMVINLHSS